MDEPGEWDPRKWYPRTEEVLNALNEKPEKAGSWGPMKAGNPITGAFFDYPLHTFTKEYVDNINRKPYNWTLYIHLTVFSSKDPKCKGFCQKEKADILITMTIKMWKSYPELSLGYGTHTFGW